MLVAILPGAGDRKARSTSPRPGIAGIRSDQPDVRALRGLDHPGPDPSDRKYDSAGARSAVSLKRLLWVLATVATLAARPAAGRDAGDPIRLAWVEGDVAGMTSILSAGGASTIGFVDYRQRRRGDVLEAVRIARFSDGSSDEDRVEARIGETLQTLRGRSIIRNAKAVATVDITIDVVGGRITGFSGLGDERQTYDESVELPPGTYWGPLIFIVIKNFEQNAADGRLVFRTVVATPTPRVFDLELLRQEATTMRRPGGKIDVVRFALRPTVNWLIDPIIRMFAPETNFFVRPGAPPGLARFEGPRNFAGQKIRIE